MDQVTQTSLEALLLRATNGNNFGLDTAAVDAFCTLVNKEREGAHIGVKVVAEKLPNGNEKEVLLTLNLIDTCMCKCGSNFQNEVGKFRFLNEMIKLVSPKYLGSKTPLSVKQKILHLLYLWTVDYPKEIKIKEAFDMLRKQGVLKEIPNPDIPFKVLNSENRRKPITTVREFLSSPDQQRSKILQKLLQSTDSEDIELANWLIKSMVKEDEKLQDVKSRIISELESVKNTLRLLNEMLDSYKQESTTSGELDLMKELYDNCVKFKTNFTNLTWQGDSSLTTDLFVNVSMAIDDLTEAVNNYNLVIEGKENLVSTTGTIEEGNYSLLQFEQNSLQCACDYPKEKNVELKSERHTDRKDTDNLLMSNKSTLDELCDIFATTTTSINTNISEPQMSGILRPVNVHACAEEVNKEKENKLKAFEDLDVLGEHLLKENLQSSKYRNQEKTPMNLLSQTNEIPQVSASSAVLTAAAVSLSPNQGSLNSDLNFLLENTAEKISSQVLLDNQDTTDDCLVDISEDKLNETSTESKSEEKVTVSNGAVKRNISRKVAREMIKCDNSIKLNDISIRLEDIRPSHMKPLVVLDDKSGITLTIHPTKDKAKPAVYVYVVTTINKNELPLGNYMFQAVVPKSCKLRLLPPSSTDLPAFNPFLPPSAITQIMLIGNPNRVQINLKCILSYVMDEDTLTEMGEIEELPLTE